MKALAVLAEPWFVMPWYTFGILAAAAVVVDLHRNNTALKRPMKWAWPIIVAFFSVLGAALYLGTARAPGIGQKQGEARQEAHHAYERNFARRVNGAVIHCVAGDGLGIVTAMVIARLSGLTFWQEFWFEYAVGFSFGWFIFQYKSMAAMEPRKPRALALAFRAEFFSMLAVMGGMGAVMTYVTPPVVGAQPLPSTYAFWGFAMLGLLAGYVFTIPMNAMMVKLGWKHGMGSMKDSHPAEGRAAKIWLLAGMSSLGAAALILPAALTELREGKVVTSAGHAVATGQSESAESAIGRLRAGVRKSLTAARQGLAPGGVRSEATTALDAAFRASMVGAAAAPGSALESVLAQVRQARGALQNGAPDQSREHLSRALAALTPPVAPTTAVGPAPLGRYRGCPVLNPQGAIIGEIARVDGDRAILALGKGRDVFGMFDLGRARMLSVPGGDLVLGPRRTLGKSYAVLARAALPPVALGTGSVQTTTGIAPIGNEVAEGVRKAEPHDTPPGQLIPAPTESARKYHRGGNVLYVVGLLESLAIPALLLLSGWAARLRTLAWRIGRRWYFSLVAFVSLIALVTFVLELPLAFYEGYVREHLYGLSRQSLPAWLGQTAGAAAVGAAVTALVIWVPYLLLRALPRWWWLPTGVLTLPLILLALVVGPRFIAPLFDRFHPLQDQQLKARILALAERAGVAADRVLEVEKADDTTKVNAYVTGLGGEKRVVLWDTLIKKLEPDEVLFVVAHELGHYVLGHVRRQVIITWILACAALAFTHLFASAALRRFRHRLGFDSLSDFASLPLLQLAASTFFLIAGPALLATSRQQERQADRFAIELTRDNAAGVRAFAKLAHENLGVPDPGPLYRFFRASHPSIGDRIRFLASYRPRPAPPTLP
jgi:STE24 endopeptidase